MVDVFGRAMELVEGAVLALLLRVYAPQPGARIMTEGPAPARLLNVAEAAQADLKANAERIA